MIYSIYNAFYTYRCEYDVNMYINLLIMYHKINKIIDGNKIK